MKTTTSPATSSATLARDEVSPGILQLFAAKAKEWGCTPEEAAAHLNGPAAIRNPHAEPQGLTRTITIKVSAAHYEEVERLLRAAEGPAVNMERKIAGVVSVWLCNVIQGYGDPFTPPASSKREGRAK